MGGNASQLCDRLYAALDFPRRRCARNGGAALGTSLRDARLGTSLRGTSLRGASLGASLRGGRLTPPRQREPQLLRDAAWSRAHLLIVDAWLQPPPPASGCCVAAAALDAVGGGGGGARPAAWLGAYERIFGQLPVPRAFV